MKKILSVFLLAVLLTIALPLQAMAAGTASLSGPDVVRAGDTITLSFKAGGNIMAGHGSISFDSNQLTLQSFNGKLSSPWVVQYSNNKFMFYDDTRINTISSNTIFTLTFKVSNSVKPGDSISVSATGIALTESDGVTETRVGTKTYTVTVAEPLSNNANLQSLTVENATISPAFAVGTTSYKASVPYSTSSLKITAAAEHAGAKVSISNNALTPNGTTKVKVTVTAEDGTTKEYVISTFRARDPNYVESTVNTLDSLSVEGFQLSPAFSVDRLDYAIYVPYETTGITINAQKTDDKSDVTIPTVENIPMGETTYVIPVEAENGEVRNYTITVFRAEPFDETIVVPVETEPETIPTEVTTAPTEAPTETTQQTEPQTQPTEPAEQEGQDPVASWLWILMAVLCFAAGGLTVGLIDLLRKK